MTQTRQTNTDRNRLKKRGDILTQTRQSDRDGRRQNTLIQTRQTETDKHRQ